MVGLWGAWASRARVLYKHLSLDCWLLIHWSHPLPSYRLIIPLFSYFVHTIMVALKLSLSSLIILFTATYAAPTSLSTIDKRATTLADGTKVVVGNLPNWSLIFRSSGVLTQGGCPATASSIATCYVQKLSANSNQNLDPDMATTGPVQTSFISTNAVPANGGVTKYMFKLQLEPGLATPSSAGSVPLVQIVSKEPVDGQGSATKVWLEAKDNKVGINAFSDTPAVSVPMSQFVGKTTVHTWTVKGGPQGWANIDIKDTAGNSILKYEVNKPNSIDSYRMRVGPIRLANSGSPYTAYFGDWNAQTI
ncbi:hypothetical protein FRC12_000623 [Ceratobasidium sp. 428]|nr:hypothetical protein FRC12_000623 [Ceratobasidium sp. 428]